MYLQVYTHKTVLSAEYTLMNILKRAKEIFHKENDLFVTKSIKPFLAQEIDLFDDGKIKEKIDLFSKIDDYDVLTCIKEWTKSKDFILSSLCNRIIKRNLLKIKELDNSKINLKKFMLIIKIKKLATVNLNILFFKYRLKIKYMTKKIIQ